MIKRLPISLKFEDTEEFYSDFIEQKKDDKELTSFIMDLLKAYYYNEDIRMMIDSYIIEQNPYIKIHEQLQKITMQHKRHANAISMLSDYNSKEMERVNSKAEEKQYNKQDDEAEKAELLRLLGKYGVGLKEEIQKGNNGVDEQPSTKPDVVTPTVEKTETIAPIVQSETAPIIGGGNSIEEEKNVPKAFKKMLGSVK